MIFGWGSQPDLAVSRARAFRRSRLWLSEALDVIERRRRATVGVTLLGVLLGLAGSWLAPALLPARPAVGAGVALIALAVGLAVATGLDAVDPRILGPRHVRACGGDLVALLPFAVDEHDADELAEAITDLQRHLGPLRIGLAPAGGDPDAAVQWSRAIALSIARTGTSVLHLDLVSPARGRPGASEVAEGLVELPDVAELRPDLRLATVGPGSDAILALEGVVGIAEAVPGDVEVVLVSLPSVTNRTVVAAAAALHQVLLVVERSLTSRVELIAAIDVLAAAGRPPQIALVDGVTYARVRPGHASAPAPPVTTRAGALERRMFGPALEAPTAALLDDEPPAPADPAMGVREDVLDATAATTPVLPPRTVEEPTAPISIVELEPHVAPDPPTMPEARTRPPWLRQPRARSRFDRFFLEPSGPEAAPADEVLELEALPPVGADADPGADAVTGPTPDPAAVDEAPAAVDAAVTDAPVIDAPADGSASVTDVPAADVAPVLDRTPDEEAPAEPLRASTTVVFDDLAPEPIAPVVDLPGAAPGSVADTATPLVPEAAPEADEVVVHAPEPEPSIEPPTAPEDGPSAVVTVAAPAPEAPARSGGVIRFDALDDAVPEPEPEPEPAPVALVEPEPEPEPVALVEPEPESEPAVILEPVARPSDPALAEDALGAAALAYLEAHAPTPVIDEATIDVSPAAQRQAAGTDGGPEPLVGEDTSPASLLRDDDVTTQLRRPETEWPSWASVEDEEDLLTTTARMAALRDQLELRDED